MPFIRFDRGDFERLAEWPRWTVKEAVCFIVNAEMQLDGLFEGNCYWKQEGEQRYKSLLAGKMFKWCVSGEVSCYINGDPKNLPISDNKYIVDENYDEENDDIVHRLKDEIYVGKNSLLHAMRTVNEEKTKEVEYLLTEKYWDKQKDKITEDELVKLLAARIINKESPENKPTKDAIIKELSFLDVGSERGKSTLYKWISQVY